MSVILRPSFFELGRMLNKEDLRLNAYRKATFTAKGTVTDGKKPRAASIAARNPNRRDICAARPTEYLASAVPSNPSKALGGGGGGNDDKYAANSQWTSGRACGLCHLVDHAARA